MPADTPAVAAQAPAVLGEAGVTRLALAWRRAARRPPALAGAAVVHFYILLALGAPWIAPDDPLRTDWGQIRKGPSAAHLFGTDDLGRDTFARVVFGGRISMLVGLIGTFVSLVIGVSWGAIAGYFGGKLDEAMMRFVDVLYSLPYIFLVILLLVFFERSLLMLFVALGLVQWLTMARIVRGQVMSLKGQTFVEAARALGASDLSIVFRHLVPNTLGPVIVYTTLTVPAVILQEAFLSFLGLGVQPPEASWGTLVSDGARVLAIFPWLVVFPGLALSLTLLAFNFLGDGLRDALDPQNPQGQRDAA